MGDCIFTTVFLMELSTPFVSIRGILSIMGLKNAKIYVVNGLVMLISFFLCRIVLLPYVMWMYSEAANLGYFEAAFALPKACKWSIAIILLPQIYWFNLMLKGASKVFFPSKQKGSSINNNSEMAAGKMVTKVD
jgi:TLC domain